jgi:glutamine---fructose-6-phosphate transaminase (isomerizing)
MCGIIGFIGNDNCFDYIFNGLYQLQNRGYDSAGIMSIQDNKFFIKKLVLNNNNKGINEFKKYKNEFKSNIGVGHTRWATHGIINNINTHPHLNNKEDIAIVHNGVIDNYLELKLFLKDYKFKSDTDTEVIANLLDLNKDISNIETIKKTINMLEGTFSLIISFLDEPNNLYITKISSPLLLSYNDDFALISSEEGGFNGIIKNYIRLDDNDIFKIEKKNKIIISSNLNKKLKFIKNNDNNDDLSYKPYNNWTEKEIFKQSESMIKCLNNGKRILNDEEVILGGLNQFKDKLKEIDNLIMLGCGSSYYASLLGKFYFKELTNLNIILPINACEFELNDIPKLGKTAILFISQSGETRDLYKILEDVKKLDVLTIGLVNTVNSTIANETDCGVYLNIGKEHGVASTKSFTSQTLLLSLMAIFFSQIHNLNASIRKDYIQDIKNINNNLQNIIYNINNECKNIANIVYKTEHIFVIGKQQSEVIALEGSLKIKEITYLHAEGYSTTMLKHGPFSLLSKDTFVIIIIPDDRYYSKSYSVLEQIKSRKSKIIAITNRHIEKADYNIIIPKSLKLQGIFNIIPLQLISYHISILRGLNPDFPRNLAKVVTVE